MCVSSSPPDRRAQGGLVESGRPIERRRDPSLAYGQDGIAQTRELGEIGGMNQRSATTGYEVADESMDLGLGRDVDALRGSSSSSTAIRRASHFARITFC